MPILTILVLLPAFCALVIGLLPRKAGYMARSIAMASSLATLGFAIAMLVSFKSNTPGYQFYAKHEWITSFGISWELGVDGISLFLVLLSALVFPILVAGSGVPKDDGLKSYMAWILLLESACIGCFLSLDIFVFFLFFELTLIPAYFLIARWGSGRKAYAATKFFLYTFFGSVFFFVGILIVAFSAKSATGQLSFDLISLSSAHALSSGAAKWLFLAFTIAFAIKAPIFPFHTWSPDAYSSAPTGGSVALAAIMAKLGTDGIIRFDLELFPQAAHDLAPLLLTLGVIGIIYGAIVAAVQKDMKKVVAYSSLSHIGFIVLGLFALSPQGLDGAVLQMINHGILVVGLFLLIAMIYRRRGTWDIGQLSGLQRAAPFLAGVFTLVMLASVGVPGLNSFVGEFLILIGTFVTHRWWAVVATVGTVLAVVYFLWVYQQVFHRKAEGENAKVADMSLKEKLVMAPIIILIVFMGIYPKPILDRITPTVNALVHQVAQANHTPKGGAR
jgi:NADH-quinone oxidoreductase subunit M